MMTSDFRMVEGRNICLRPAYWGFNDEELRRRYRWSLDDVLQYWSGSIPSGRTFVAFRESVGERDWPSDGRRVSYAILTKTGDLIGMISCYNIDRGARTGEIGIYLGEKNMWGNGYGTDAMIAFLGHLFHDFGLESVYLHTYESNARAQRSYMTAGFRMEDKRRRYSPRAGYHQEVKMTVSRQDFDILHGQRDFATAP